MDWDEGHASPVVFFTPTRGKLLKQQQQQQQQHLSVQEEMVIQLEYENAEGSSNKSFNTVENFELTICSLFKLF